MSEKRVQKSVFKIVISIVCLILTVSVAAVGLQNHNKKSTGYAPTVLIGNTQYVICGDEGEAEILKNCDLPAKLTADLVGKFVSYLDYDGEHNYTLTENETEISMFEYKPQPNTNVYIVRIDGKYFAAVKYDGDGYHGIKQIAQ